MQLLISTRGIEFMSFTGARRFLLIVLAAVATAGLSACSNAVDNFEPRLSNGNEGYNRTITNDVVVNILRAGDYEPLSFVGAGKFTANRNFDLKAAAPSVTLSSTAPLTQIAGNSLDLATNSQIEATSLNTGPFRAGLMTPLTLRQVKSLIEEGYPREVILNLVLDRIVLRDAKSGRETELRNDPSLDIGQPCERFDYTAFANGLSTKSDGQSPYQPGGRNAGCEYHQFQWWIEEAMRYGINVDLLEPAAKPAAAKDEAKDKSSDMKVTAADKKPAEKSGRFCFDLSKMSPYDQDALLRANTDFRLHKKAESPICTSTPIGKRSADPLAFVGSSSFLFPEFRFRSTAAIFKFLGEIVDRNSSAQTELFERSSISARDSRLFTLVPGRTENCYVTVPHAGVPYCLPSESRSSKAVVAILASLIQLNTSREDIPINTATINVTP